MRPQIRRIGRSVDLLGECPLWDQQSSRLHWVDSMAGLVHRLDPITGRHQTFHVPAPLGSLGLTGDGRAILALRDSLALFDFDAGSLMPLAGLSLGPDLRLNDGEVDPQGRFVTGTLQLGDAPVRIETGLYRLEADGSIQCLDHDIDVANGPCFSPDGRTLYLADSRRRCIWAYAYHEHDAPTDRRLFLDTRPFDSAPDGATVDADGFLWSALVLAGAVARFAPDGRLDRLIRLPVTHPTSVAFGGPGLETLYVTSISRSPRLACSMPDAGGLLAIDGLGVRGLPTFKAAVPSGVSPGAAPRAP